MAYTQLMNRIHDLVDSDENKKTEVVEWLAETNDIEKMINSDFSIDDDGNASYCYTALSASAHRESGPMEVDKCDERKLDKSDLLDLIGMLEGM